MFLHIAVLLIQVVYYVDMTDDKPPILLDLPEPLSFTEHCCTRSCKSNDCIPHVAQECLLMAIESMCAEGGLDMKKSAAFTRKSDSHHTYCYIVI